MDPIVRLAASALPGEKKYILFAGAGVSKDANLPTAWDLMLDTASMLYATENPDAKSELNPHDLAEWFESSKYAQLSYSELINLFFPHYPEQQSYLHSFLAGKEIGESHRFIAELARREMIRAVITTNFDPYIEKALEEKGFEVQVITSVEDIEHTEPLIQCKKLRVYKPHGTLEKGKLLNTPKDLESLPLLMEDELVKIMSEHGVIVLGYSGSDPDIITVFKRRSNNFYPVYWIDPNLPSDDIKFILDDDRNSYIECSGASQFLSDLIDLQERIKSIAPSSSNRPTIPQLSNALSEKNQPIGPLFLDYFTSLIDDLQLIQPDFSKFSEFDDAIIDQIKKGEYITYQYIEATILASKYNDQDAIKAAYTFFECMLIKYDSSEKLDGNKYLGYEMFLGLIASLLKYERWEEISTILQIPLFIRTEYRDFYESFIFVNKFIRSLDEWRNNRLQLNRTSISADLMKDRFEHGRLKRFFTFEEIAEADYFLFMRTVCHDDDDLRNTWRPIVSIYLQRKVPSYISRSELDSILEKVTLACGFNNSADFISSLKFKNHHFLRYHRKSLPTNPLSLFDLDKLGKISQNSSIS